MEINELNKNARGGTELMQEKLEQYVPAELLNEFQIIQSRAREIDPDKRTIYWLHDLPSDPEVQHLKDGGWKKYDKLVFVSHWQQQMYNLYLGVPFSAGVVLKNAITPIEEHSKPNDGKIRLIYTSTPHRGLNILYAVFEALAKEYDDIELDVYSSFRLYGWPQRDEPYNDLFEKLRNHKQINYHSAKSNEEVREALKKAHIFAYPSTWQETSCLSLIEAMSAGCLCVHPNFAALPETSMHQTLQYQYSEDIEAHANIFYQYLKQSIEGWKRSRKSISGQLNVQRQLTSNIFNWNIRAREWEQLLNYLLTLDPV
jgi:UDP-glucose:(glucosyl)LPS alpha-1,2-glucosyltransferase